MLDVRGESLKLTLCRTGAAENLTEIIRLGCIDAFLKLMAPSNPNADAVIYALSLIADEADAIFPRELTVSTSLRMLETLRGAAKRSKNASAMGFLFAALAKSPLFHAALCTEASLSILSKLLVGGSTDVLCASAFALGVVGTSALSDRVKELLFQVEAPQNLMKLLGTASSASATAVNERVVRLVIFALASMLHDGVTLSIATARAVYPDAIVSDSLRSKMLTCCRSLVAAPALVDQIYDRAVHQLSIGSTYATMLLACLSLDDAIKRKCCNAPCVERMLTYTRAASPRLLATCLAFFIECTSPLPRPTSALTPLTTSSTELAPLATELSGEASAWTSEAFCTCVQAVERTANSASERETDAYISLAVLLFETHPPNCLFGLPVLLRHFVETASAMKTQLSVRPIVDATLVAVTRLNHVALHDQALQFLDALTQHKNAQALHVLFAADPERVANLLHSPHAPIQLLAATLLRRLFKRLNALEIPTTAALRHLVKLMSSSSVVRSVAVAAARVWGNLFLYVDKRVGFAKIPNAVGVLLVLLSACAADASSSDDHEASSSALTALEAPDSSAAKHLHIVMRSVYRAFVSDDVKRVAVTAPHFLCVVELFTHSDARVVHLAIESMTEIARVHALRKHVAVAPVLTVVNAILRDRDDASAAPGKAKSRAIRRVDALRFVSALSKKDAWAQRLLLEYKIVDAAVLLLHSPLAALDWELLCQCLETLAWLASGIDSPVRSVLATAKLVDFALRHVDSAREQVTSAALHLLQRLSFAMDVKDMVKAANGPAIIMRALSHRNDYETKRRACSLIRNLVQQHGGNRAQFQSLGANSYLVTLVTSSALERQTLKLRIKGLYAIAAMAEGTTPVAKASKHELLECDDAPTLVRLVSAADDPRLCAAWCFALAMLAVGSSGNQRKLIETGGIVELLVHFIAHCQDAPLLRVVAAQLLAYVSAMPENRTAIMRDGGDALLAAIIDALQSDVHELQRFIALSVAHLATRSDEHKVRLGASGVIAPLVDRLSSKQLNVLENVLSAVTRLGSHAGNKVKFGSKVCFEKLLALVHHDELAIRKSAVSAIAVLIEGNDGNKKCLLQCEARVVTELCALMRATNGKVVESAMLILGELAVLPDQTLEISKAMDIVVLVRMVEHVNVKIKRAALTTVLHLTKESFNKLRFGIRECLLALLRCLQSDDLRIVELAIGCLANLSFTPANASQIAQSNALTLLLKLAAASTTAKDYLTWKEARFLRLDKSSSAGSSSPQKDASAAGGSNTLLASASDGTGNSALSTEDGDSDGDDGEWSDSHELAVYARHGGSDSQSDEVLDFSSFPSRQTAVLEQTLLVLSNCADECHARGLVEAVAIKVICQALQHPSELVKRCACFLLGVWCKQDTPNQETATAAGVLPTLIQLLNSPTLSIVEAALYALGKLSYYSDNHVKMLQLDVLTTVVQGILRRSSNVTHDGLLDRALRLLGTLVRFAKVRQVLKSEEVISDILTHLLQMHKDALAKNTSRLVLAMLEEESLKFFLPKKTVTLLRAIFTDARTTPKTVRNVLQIFRIVALVEEHKTTIALEDSGEALGKMVTELRVVAEVEENLLRMPASAPNADTILPLLANIAVTKRIATILFDKKVCAVLPQYLAPFEPRELEGDGAAIADASATGDEQLRHVDRSLHAVVIAKHLCASLQERAVAKLSGLESTSLLLGLLRTSMELLPQCLTRLSVECLVVLERLCARTVSSSAHDQQVLSHEAGVDVLMFYLALWLRIAVDGDRRTPPALELACEAFDNVLPLEFIAPLAQLVHHVAMHADNRNALVCSGGTMLLLQSMGVAALPYDLRACCATALAIVSELPVAKDVFDRDDHVALLYRFMVMHERDAPLLLQALRTFASIVERSPPSRHRVLAHPPALAFLLECLADAESDVAGSKLYYAVRALECLSMEKEVALCLAPLDALPRVPQLLLLPLESISRETQYFATNMVGHMAFFGHAERLALTEPMVARVLTFASFQTDAVVTAASIKLALWALAQLAKSSLSATVCAWIVRDAGRLDVLIQCGLLPPPALGISSAVVGYALSILLCIVTVEDVVAALVHKRVCTPLAALLEAVEHDIHVAALQILALLLPRYAAVGVGHDATTALANSTNADEADKSSSRSESWPAILRHVVEWMEVYARDPSSCSVASLLDAYVCLSTVAARTADVASAFTSTMVRTGIAEIVASTMRYFDTTLQQEQQRSAGAQDALCILLLALQVCRQLMTFASVYSDKFLALDAPAVLESVLQLSDAALQLETLECMLHLATRTPSSDSSKTAHLLFASPRCVTRLKQLAHTASDLAIVANATSLLALMATALPSLPGLCCLDGIDVVSRLVHTHWTAHRTPLALRVTDDCCHVLLALFASDDNVFALYDQTSVIARLFAIVEAHGAPELPLRVLVKISDYTPSHARFLPLLLSLCRLLSGDTERLSTPSHELILLILCNIFCRFGGDNDRDVLDIDANDRTAKTLSVGASSVLPQVLPLARWVRVANTRATEVVLQLLHAYVSTATYKTLLNDGVNTVALLELVNADATAVAVAAAHVLLRVSDEREMHISITVEDGVGVLVRKLQRTDDWQLQCLLLTILRTMSADSEVQVLIVNDSGVARLVRFVHARQSARFADDERLALSCAILQQLSHTLSAATQIVACNGHTALIELNASQLTSTTASDESECSVTLEALTNLTQTASVVPQLLVAKVHELFLRYVLASDASHCDSSDGQQAICSELALRGLRALCKANRDVRRTLGLERKLVPLLEAILVSGAATSTSPLTPLAHDALALLQYVSKTPEGRASIVAESSQRFLELLCQLITRASHTTAALAIDASAKSSVSAPSPASSKSSASASSAEALLGLKLIANVVTDTTDARVHTSWSYAPLESLSPLLEALVANHQQPTRQLTALRVLSGASVHPAFYFPLSPQMLSDLLNAVLISASRQHCALAEDVVVRAFKDAGRVRASVSGNQILEQLLIVVTQKTSSSDRHALSAALTEVLYVSVERGFVVNQRFVAKLLSLLASFASDAPDSSSERSDDGPLVRALCVYLSFVFKSASPASALQSNLREVLRSEVNAAALECITDEVLRLHTVVCRQSASQTNSESSVPQPMSSENVLLWSFFAECLAPLLPHVQRMLERTELLQWLCLVDDFFAVAIDASAPAPAEPNGTDSPSPSIDSDAKTTAASPLVGHISSALASLKVASVLTRLNRAAATEDAAALQRSQQRVGVMCLETLWTASTALDEHHASVEAALATLLDVRDGWSEQCLLDACKAFAFTPELLVHLLAVFHSPYRALNRSRHLLLQLLLTLVSTGSYVHELKASAIQAAIENNELIAAADKALPITILSLLGYNADLNSEFALALERCASAPTAAARTEHLAYLVHFLQLYALTDEALQQRAIGVFMRELVVNAAVLDVDHGATEADVVAASASTRHCVAGLVKLATVRKFVDLYLQDWTLGALLCVTFARTRGDASNDFEERPVLSLSEMSELLDLAARICAWLGTPANSAPLPGTGGAVCDEHTLTNALTLVGTLPREQLAPVEQVLELLLWLISDAACFELVCVHASMLNAFLPFLFAYSDSATATLLRLVETCVRSAPRVEALNELVTALLELVYAHAAPLAKRPHVRDKLQLYVLLLLKRLGEDGLAGTDVYEHAVQRILAHIRAPTEAQARVTWSLLGMLTEFDAAIVTIFNVDGIPMLLREFCVEPSAAAPARVATNARGAFQMEALKCLSKAARTHDEVLLKIGATDGITAMLFAVLANAAAMLALGNDDTAAAAVDIGEAQEHAAHLIARLAQQEDLRASLLSPDHVAVLIESMESVHLPVVLYALEALHHLCDFAMCLDALVRHATVPVLGQILVAPLADDATQRKTEAFVLGILASMCAKSKLICRRVVSSNLVAKLNVFLSATHASTSVQHSAVSIIYSLSKDTELVPKLRDHGVAETLADELLSYDAHATQAKALGALANVIALSRVSVVATDPALARAIVRETVEAINRNVPLAHAQDAIAAGLRVLEALAALTDDAKALLLEEGAVQLALALFGASDASVRLHALRVATQWVEANRDAAQIRELFADDAVLLYVARAVSEGASELLLVALALVLLLVHDEVLKDKLTAMTYDVLLRLVGTHAAPSLSTAQSKVLLAALEALAAMTATATTGTVAVSTSAEVVNSVEPLVLLLRTAVSDAIRIHALHVLVNFAAAVELRGAMVRGGMLTALVAMLDAAVRLRDDTVAQLSLLGMALLTTATADLSAVVRDLAGATVATLVELLGSRNRNVQANAVWVLSNLSTEGASCCEMVCVCVS